MHYTRLPYTTLFTSWCVISGRGGRGHDGQPHLQLCRHLRQGQHEVGTRSRGSSPARQLPGGGGAPLPVAGGAHLPRVGGAPYQGRGALTCQGRQATSLHGRISTSNLSSSPPVLLLHSPGSAEVSGLVAVIQYLWSSIEFQNYPLHL